MITKPWSLFAARGFIEMLAIELELVGYSVGLTGSVLLEGQSDNDLDIIIYPRSTAKQDEAGLYRTLEMSLSRIADREKVSGIWRKKGSQDEKHVEVWLWEERRVDIFFLK